MLAYLYFVLSMIQSDRRVVVCSFAVAVAALSAALTAAGLADAPATESFHAVDTGLCPFRLSVSVRRVDQSRRIGSRAVQQIGPTTVMLRNMATGRTAVLRGSGSFLVNSETGGVTFQGHQIWLASQSHVPYLSTDGTGREDAPDFVLEGGSRARVIDPCALVASSPQPTRPVATPAPWRLPASALSQIAYAGLIPVLGNLIRHDHVHLDVIVNGRRIVVPAGVGIAEPLDAGRCPSRQVRNGDCATDRFYTGEVALSPIHTHSASGIIHVESDRPGTFTLGEFFDEWGVRFTSKCVGGYCSGGAKQLKVFVDGKRVTGDPRSVELRNREEIVVLFGNAKDFAAVPSTYSGGWPGLGCGGTAERSCFR